MGRVVVVASLISGAMVAAAVIVPDATAQSSLIATHPRQVLDEAPAKTIWQGTVVAAGSDWFSMTVDTVWSPTMAFDIGSRTVHVTTATVFDPPVWNIGNLGVGENVAVTLEDASARSPVATGVTVVDPD